MTRLEKQYLGSAAWALGIAMPGVFIANGLPEQLEIPLFAFQVLATIAGGLGAWLYTHERPVATIILGALGGLGTVSLIPPYLAWRATMSERYLTLELILPTAAVALPLFAIWRWLDRRQG